MFSIGHRDGWGEKDPPIDCFSALYDELQGEDPEHLDVLVSHDSGWTIVAYPNGLVILQDLSRMEEIAARHMSAVTKDRVVALWLMLASGNIEGVLREPWQPGEDDRSANPA